MVYIVTFPLAARKGPTVREALRVPMTESIEFHNHRRYHKGSESVTPAEVYYGQTQEIRKRRKEQKR